jgi:protein TonB
MFLLFGACSLGKFRAKGAAMPFLPPEFRTANLENRSSWSTRIRENLQAAFAMPMRNIASSAVEATPFALVCTNTRYGPAQTVSVATHVAVIFAFLFLFAAQHNLPPGPKPPSIDGRFSRLALRSPVWRTGAPSVGLRSGGGGNEEDPARAGLLPPPSSLPLAPPRVTHSDFIELGVPPAVYDASAPANPPLVTNLGLPSRDKDTHSAGNGKGLAIGDKQGDGVGDDEGSGAGLDTSGPYANLVSQAACLYCPEPPYTDEARKTRLQGILTVRVLIGADGRAHRIQIVKGLGMGLDENAIAAIQAWRFAPARDARKQPVASWATIETRFQLF